MKSLGEIIADIEVTCALLEELETIPESVVSIFKDLEGELSTKVDRWIGKLEATETLLEHARKKREAWDKRVQMLKNLEEKMKTYLTFHMQQTAMPELKGEEGRLKLYKNSQPRLNLNLPAERLSLPHTLKPFLFQELAAAYPEFFQEVRILNVDTASLKNALTSGRKLDFATIEQGHHVRILL